MTSRNVARTHEGAPPSADGPWLEAIPPFITMLPESPRLPYPITWKEQDTLFRKLPAHLAVLVDGPP
jgi:hypothetical protein